MKNNKKSGGVINAQTIVQRKVTAEIKVNLNEFDSKQSSEQLFIQSKWQKRWKNLSSTIYILFVFCLLLTVLPNILTHYTFATILLIFLSVGTKYDHEVFRNFYLISIWFIYENIFQEECSVPIRIGCDYLNGSVGLSQLFNYCYFLISFVLYVFRLRSLSTVIVDLKYYIFFLSFVPKFCYQILDKLILPTVRCLLCCWCCGRRDRFIIKRIETSVDSNVVQIKEL